jgi:hypothetical protein
MNLSRKVDCTSPGANLERKKKSKGYFERPGLFKSDSLIPEGSSPGSVALPCYCYNIDQEQIASGTDRFQSLDLVSEYKAAFSIPISLSAMVLHFSLYV